MHLAYGAVSQSQHHQFGLTGKKVDSIDSAQDLNLQRMMHNHASNTAGVAHKRHIGTCECTQQDKPVIDKSQLLGLPRSPVRAPDHVHGTYSTPSLLHNNPCNTLEKPPQLSEPCSYPAKKKVDPACGLLTVHRGKVQPSRHLSNSPRTVNMHTPKLRLEPLPQGAPGMKAQAASLMCKTQHVTKCIRQNL